MLVEYLFIVPLILYVSVENKKGIEIDSLSFFPSLKATLSGKQAEVSSLKLSVVKINSSLEKKTALSKVIVFVLNKLLRSV